MNDDPTPTAASSDDDRPDGNPDPQGAVPAGTPDHGADSLDGAPLDPLQVVHLDDAPRRGKAGKSDASADKPEAGRDAAIGASVPYLPARSEQYRKRKNARERAARAALKARGQDPQMRGIADLRKVLAVAEDEDTYELGDILCPPRPAGCPGRQRDYPGFLLIIFLSGVEAWGNVLSTVTNLRDSAVWNALLDAVRRTGGQERQEQMRRTEPPTLEHLKYVKKQWNDDPELRARFHDACRRLAVGKAQEQGRLLPTREFSLTQPDLDQYVFLDGVVVGSPSRSLQRTVQDPDTGKELPVRYDESRGPHWQGGEGNKVAHGAKFCIAANRGKHYGSRIVLDVRNQPPGEHAEGRLLVAMFNDIVALAPGTQGLLTDGILRHVHMKPIMDAGRLPIVPVTAFRNGDRYRTGKEHNLPDATFEDAKGRKCKHELVASDGRVYERRQVNRSAPRLEVLDIFKPERRPAGPVTLWYHVVALPCRRVPHQDGGVHLHRVPIAHDPKDQVPFNRLEYLRIIPPGTAAYLRAYPRRLDAEAVNREFKRNFDDNRIPAYGMERQTLVMLLKAHTMNAVSRWLYRNPQALARPGVHTGPPAA